jgi:hypothetical protein
MVQEFISKTDIALPGSVYKINNSLYCLIPENLRLNQLFFIRAKYPFSIINVEETSDYVDVTYRFKKKKA